jgi:beta-barrel assembly-enhancing protease
MRKWFSLLGACSVLVTGAVGCQTVGGAVGGLTGAAADVVLPPAEEERLGEQLSREIEQQVTLHADPQVQQYVQRLGRDVLRSAERRGDVPEGITFTFQVVDDDEHVNAFTLPGGKIYLFSGLLLAAESEAEVAGVLAHEVAHVTQRHIAQRLTTQFGLSALASIALGRDPGVLQQLAAQVIGTGALLSFSREQEREADRFAIPYLVEAGYAPEGLVTFFQRMAEMQGQVPGVLQLLQTHPAPADRVQLARQQIAELGDPPTRLGRAEHQAFKRQVL